MNPHLKLQVGMSIGILYMKSMKSDVSRCSQLLSLQTRASAIQDWIITRNYYQASPTSCFFFPLSQASRIPWKTLWHEIRSCGCVPSSPWIFVQLSQGGIFKPPATESRMLSGKTQPIGLSKGFHFHLICPTHSIPIIHNWFCSKLCFGIVCLLECIQLNSSFLFWRWPSIVISYLLSHNLNPIFVLQNWIQWVSPTSKMSLINLWTEGIPKSPPPPPPPETCSCLGVLGHFAFL